MDNDDADMHDDDVDMGNDDMTETVELPTVGDSLGDAEKDRDVFLTNLALFYLRMQAKMLLPASTISTLIEEFQEVCTNAISQVFVKLHEELSQLEIPEERICSIIDGLSKANLLKMYNEGFFRSDTTRKIYFKKNFSYVEPIQVHLGFGASGKEHFCQYVPVKETLKALLNQPSVRKQYNVSKINLPEDPNVLEDVRDGKIFKDSFEVVNPLGSGKKTHKLLAIYMTLGEILPHNRSSVDPIQLVMLCRESDYHFFGQEKVFSCLVNDLKNNEQSGITLETSETVKGVVIAIVGDNLGSHSLGGFTENFSKSHDFCRYCLITRDRFANEPTKLGPKRTPESYRSSVEKLSMGSENNVDGVKFDSVFNSLGHFHVYQPGLPPLSWS